MARHVAAGFAAAAICLCAVAVSAQDLVVRNARILDGRGGMIERGTIVIENGRITAVGDDRRVRGGRMLDARGMTVMPGFVEAHRHLIEGDPAEWLENEAPARMREFLEAGFTTVFSAIDATEQILELRRRLAAGEVLGPRLRAAGFVPLSAAPSIAPPGVDPARYDNSRPGMRPTDPAPAIPPEQIRAMVARLAAAGVDAIKTVIVTSPGGPEQATLAIVAEEAARHGIPSVTHAVSVQDTLAAIAAGTDVLVHTPHVDLADEDDVRRIVAAGIPMVSTLGVFVPAFDAGNAPMFRDDGPFPMATLASAGQGPVNARRLWDAGITYAYGTDTSWAPRDTLAHELRPLTLVFSGADIVRIITSNAAVAVGLEDQIGAVEPGKLADLVLIDGDPLRDPYDLLDVAVVIKGGEIVVDSR